MIEDLIPDYPHHLERLLGGNGVDEEIAVDADEVFRVENGVLILWWVELCQNCCRGKEG